MANKRGGFREGAGRKKGFAALEAEKTRDFIARKIAKNLTPMIDAMIVEVKEGNVQAFEKLFDRGHGKVKDSLEITDPDGFLKSVRIVKNGSNDKPAS